MSKLPTSRGSKPQMNTSTQSTTRDARTGAVKTTTRTTVTELRPSSASGICQPCDAAPSRIERRNDISQLQPSRTLRPQDMPMPDAESTRICAATLNAPPREYVPRERRGPPAAVGNYPIPAQYGSFGPPTNSTNLQGQNESNVPKNLRFSTSRPPYETSQRTALKGTQLQNNLRSETFNVSRKLPTEVRTAQDLNFSNKTSDPNEVLNLANSDVMAVEQQVQQDLLQEYSIKKNKVYKKGKSLRKIRQDVIQTPAGIEPVIQQTYTEKRVERDPEQERVIKNVSVTNLGSRITLSQQQINPDYGLPEGYGEDVVTIKETIAVTPKFITSAKDVSHKLTKRKVTVDPEELASLVAEETEDVENILQMTPPDMPLNPERYAIKKRLQTLRLNSESMILLEKSISNPPATADDAMTEISPEALVNIMHTIEAEVTPQCAPDQVFNTLFQENNPQYPIQLSSVGPGPVRDVVVPQEITRDVHKEAMTSDLNKLTRKMKNLPNVEDVPYIDIFSRLMDDSSKRTVRKVQDTQKSFKPIGEMPWSPEDIEPIVNVVGAEPIEVLNPINIDDLEQSGKLQEELANGMEYFVEADPLQYVSIVQLRGSQPPSWFPGYIYALPEFRDVVKVARSPNEVFYASWKSVQPRLMTDQNVSILP